MKYVPQPDQDVTTTSVETPDDGVPDKIVKEFTLFDRPGDDYSLSDSLGLLPANGEPNGLLGLSLGADRWIVKIDKLKVDVDRSDRVVRAYLSELQTEPSDHGIDSTAPVVIDSTSQAVFHYYFGGGQDARLGSNTTQNLMQHERTLQAYRRLESGQTSPSGNFAVDMKAETFHIGQTRVDYATVCDPLRCTTTFKGFSGDGFWDPIFDYDGSGTGGEMGGTPYRYSPHVWQYSYPKPQTGGGFLP